MSFSIVLIVPANHLVIANKMGEALGWGADNFSVPLSVDGRAPVTAWGLHTTGSQGFLDLLAGMGQGVLPPADWAAFGLSGADITATFGAMIQSVPMPPPDSPSAHFFATLAANNLRRLGDVDDPPLV